MIAFTTAFFLVGLICARKLELPVPQTLPVVNAVLATFCIYFFFTNLFFNVVPNRLLSELTLLRLDEPAIWIVATVWFAGTLVGVLTRIGVARHRKAR